ncbi:MAG: 1-acyl-sn-glycerol-3-phosphate acyltransferase [Elusimicrobiota bacterium]|jgi:1-acyl-sn-glycerol-3-phosphate acyltransferase|nr:1-acyl-sn-glycerol-3-phosphate acyltransferase [Elusimicrobiota bacterium]
MLDFLKRVYAFPFVAGTWVWLSLSGMFAYPYFYITGFNPKQLRYFLYFQGRVLQTAILFASAFYKKKIKKALPSQPSILIANHPCTYDTFLFFDFGIKDLVCIAKGWPFKIPIYGNFIKKAGYINTDNATSAQIIEQVKERFKEGLHVAIFPEGHRSLTTGRFHLLAFEISIKTESPLVPFVIKGLGQMLAPGEIFARWAKIEYVQLDSVDCKKFKGMPAGNLRMAQYVKNEIIKELEREN